MALKEATLGDALIPVINKLQDIFSQVTVDLKLSLPQVAVIGSQSSGKSSVLEALVGRDFLPRGSDIVTRRPLVLQLVKTAPSANSGKPSEWGEFLHAPGKLFYDFDKIRQEIQAETDRVVGTNKNVSDKPIRLKIFSPHVLTMTLVDLPGTTKVPVGDQPSNIEARIREMVLDAIKPPSVIILAVTPANSDLANSDGLQLARMVDPEGLRTIGVLTKLDIMDRGTSAAHILRNLHIPLRLGYVAVVNRSQADINANTPLGDARRAEDAFFAGRPEYRDVVSQCGTTNLARRLNALLVEHIRALLPGLRRAIGDALEARGAELRSLGDPLPVESKSAQGAYLLQKLCEYAERFAAMLEGRHQDLSTKSLSGGARIRAVFNDGYAPALRDMAACRDVSDDAILTVIKNGAGVAGNLLVPQEPFELLVRRSVMMLLPPALSCKDAVYEELLRIAEVACPAEIARFPGLQRGLAGAVLEFIRSGAEPAERMIRSLVECEHDFINCDHPEFIGGRGAIRAVMQERSLRVAGGGLRKDEAPKEGPAAAAASAPAVARNKSAHAGQGDAGKGAGGGPTGLKGIPEPSAHSSDELLSRTRRRSDDGFGSSYHHDSVMRLGAGAASAGALNVSGLAPPASAASGSSSSWFSWLKGGSDKPAQTMDDTQVGLRVGHRVGGGSHGSASGHGGSSARTEQEEVEVEVIRRLVDSYFGIVRRNLADAVPKAVMHFMVNNTKRGLQQHLIQQLYREELLGDLLAEREDVMAQRRACKEALGALQAAVKALEELPNELAGSSATAGSAPIPMLGASTGSTQGSGFGSAFLQPAQTPYGALGLGYDPAVAALPSGAGMDRHPSMLVAARVATVATASLTSHNESIMGNGQRPAQLVS